MGSTNGPGLRETWAARRREGLERVLRAGVEQGSCIGQLLFASSGVRNQRPYYLTCRAFVAAMQRRAASHYFSVTKKERG